MRPAARMPKLTRRSRILIAVALVAVLLLLIGPRLIDAYVDWLWFGELGYRSVFTTVLVTRLVLFLVVSLLIGAIVFAALGAGLPHPAGVRPHQRPQRSGRAVPHRGDVAAAAGRHRRPGVHRRRWPASSRRATGCASSCSCTAAASGSPTRSSARTSASTRSTCRSTGWC